MKHLRTLIFAIASAVASTVSATVGLAAEVNVYSYRQPFLVEPLFDAFTKLTGYKVNVISPARA